MSDVEVRPYAPQPERHRCSHPHIGDIRYGKDSTWQCDECGRYWVKDKVIPPGPRQNALFASEWERVRWFDFGKKRRIRDIS